MTIESKAKYEQALADFESVAGNLYAEFNDPDTAIPAIRAALTDKIARLDREASGGVDVASLRKRAENGTNIAQGMAVGWNQCLDHLQSIGALALAGGWQDISTAPRDGTEVWAVFCRQYDEGEKAIVYGPWVVRYDGKKWQSSWDNSPVIDSQSDFGTEYKEPDTQPTHWQPLPAAPNAGEVTI